MVADQEIIIDTLNSVGDFDEMFGDYRFIARIVFNEINFSSNGTVSVQTFLWIVIRILILQSKLGIIMHSKQTCDLLEKEINYFLDNISILERQQIRFQHDCAPCNSSVLC